MWARMSIGIAQRAGSLAHKPKVNALSVKHSSTELHICRRFLMTPAFHKIIIFYRLNNSCIGTAAALHFPRIANNNSIHNDEDHREKLKHHTNQLGDVYFLRCKAFWCAIERLGKPAHAKTCQATKQRQKQRPCELKGSLGNRCTRINKPPCGTTFSITANTKCHDKGCNVKASDVKPPFDRMVALMECVLTPLEGQ